MNQKPQLSKYVLHIGRWTFFIGRCAWYSSAVVLALLALLFMLARLWLPTLADRKPEIEDYLSSKSSYLVKIENLSTYWDGLHPGLRAQGINIHVTGDAPPTLRLKELRISLALLPLLRGNIEAASVVLVKPELSASRSEDGKIKVSGFPPLITHVPPIEAGSASTKEWASRLHNLTIEEGNFTWTDLQGSGKTLVLSNFNLRLDNEGDRHSLSVSADFPENLCIACSLSIDMTGNPLAGDALAGSFYLRALGVNLAALPVILRERLPPDLNGRFDLQLWSEIEQDKPISAKGYINVAALNLPLPMLKSPLAINSLGANFAWETRGEGWQLDMRGLNVGLSGPAWTAGHLRLRHAPQQSSFRVEHVNLDDLTAFLESIEMDNPVLAHVAKLRPGGRLRNVQVTTQGDWRAPADFHLQVDITGLQVEPFEKFPGVQNLSGKLTASRMAGVFELDTGAASFNLPHMFRSPLDVRRLSGRLEWRKDVTADTWEIAGNNLRVIADDLKGNGEFKLLLPADKAQSPLLKLQVDFRDGNLRHARRYYPINIMQPKFLEWMDRAIVAGYLSSGEIVLEGKLKEFPFQDGGGIFEFSGRVEDGAVDYLPQWAKIERADIDLLFQRGEMLITARQAKMRDMRVNDLVAYSPDLSRGSEKQIQITGTLDGDLHSAIQIMRDSQEGRQNRWTQLLARPLDGSGEGMADLDIRFSALHPADMELSGEFRTQNGRLRLPLADLAVNAVRGSVEFSHHGIARGRLTGAVLGGDAQLVIEGKPGTDGGAYATLFKASGVLTAEGLAQDVSEWLGPFVEGSAPWQASLLMSGEKPRLEVSADMENFAFKFPAPLAKAHGEKSVLTMNTSPSAGDEHVIAVQLGQIVHGQLLFKWQDYYWAYWGGMFGLAEADAKRPSQPGVHLHARNHVLDADEWISALRRPRAGGEGLPAFLTRISGDFDSTYFLDRRIGSVSVDLMRNGEHWVGPIGGDAAAGQMDMVFESPVNSIALTLQTLNLPFETFRKSDGVADPRSLPNLKVTSQSLGVGAAQLGTLDFKAVHSAQGWRLSRMQLARPEMTVISSGKWQRVAGRDTAELVTTLKSSDTGKTLTALGSPDQLAGGALEVNAALAWKGVQGLGLDNMTGAIELSGAKGRFLKVSQGAGRLLGLFDLSAITRYLTLDFSSVFGKGYAYDSIMTKIDIENGDAYTHDMQIKGPSADLHISGRVGLTQKDYDLVVGVNPSLAETLAITTWGLGAPQVGALILLFKNTLNKQFSKGTRITYTIKGPWNEPVVTRIGRVDGEKQQGPAQNSQQ